MKSTFLVLATSAAFTTMIPTASFAATTINLNISLPAVVVCDDLYQQGAFISPLPVNNTSYSIPIAQYTTQLVTSAALSTSVNEHITTVATDLGGATIQGTLKVGNSKLQCQLNNPPSQYSLQSLTIQDSSPLPTGEYDFSVTKNGKNASFTLTAAPPASN